MQVIPVIDLLGGQVVRGIGGRRIEYRPVESKIAADARPATVARAFVERFGFETAYVADLDAIMHGKPDVKSWREIAAAGLELWLDAGIGNLAAARQALDLVTTAKLPIRLVVGLETLASLQELIAIAELVQPRKPLFSLDLKGGRPITRIAAWREFTPVEIAEAIGPFVEGVIVLDLSDVGTGRGTSTLPLCRQLRQAQPKLRIVAGGGVRGSEDLREIASAGCEAALVASALHDGRLTYREKRHAGHASA